MGCKEEKGELHEVFWKCKAALPWELEEALRAE